MRVPRIISGSILAFVPILASSLVHATTVSVTEQFGFAGSTFSPGILRVAFPKFDTSLGTLNSIRFTLVSDFASDFDNFGNGGVIAPGGTYELFGHHETAGSATIVPLGAPPQFGFTFTRSGDLGCAVENTGSVPDFFSCDSLGAGGGAYLDMFVVDPADHGLFLAGPPGPPFDPIFDTFDVEFLAEVDASCSANVGGCSVVSELQWGLRSQRGQLTVEYTFNEGPPPSVPEPTTLLLLGLGLAGLGFARKRLH